MKWKILPVPPVADDYELHFRNTRLNSLGSLYWFAKHTLGYSRLTTLHKDLCKSLENEHLFLVMEVPMSHFKALDIRTPIPTPDGFKLMGHINVGDTVFGSDGIPVKVTGVSPIYFSSDCYELEFTGGDKIDCDAGHLWETQSLEDYDRTKPRMYRSVIRTTKEISSRIDYGKQRNHRVKLAKSIQLPDVDLPISPYVLGCWLGDGTSANGSITIGNSDEWLAHEIRREGEPLTKANTPLKWCFYDGKSNYRDSKVRKFAFVTRLRKLGVLNNKHIPQAYLRSSARQRLALLQGLMDTDGHASKLGQCTFSNTNKNLVVQVRELVCSLGLKCGELRTYKSMLNRKHVGLFHVITFYSFKDFPPFRMPRKVARLLTRSPQSMQSYRHIRAARRIGQRYVKCIMVDSADSLYLAGEGFIPTHNTRLGISLSIWWALPFDEYDEKHMRELGYGDEWIRYMKAIHDQNHRTLITHEIASQATNIGRDVNDCYMNNDTFRATFKEIIPDSECTWNNSEKFQKRLRGGDASTGTFVYRGVGQALQGIHVNSIIQDDNFGKEAQDSLLKGDGRIVEDLIKWHKQVGTRFDPKVKRDRRQVVIGNKWAALDLNGYIKKNQPEFKFESHSAEGGCCKRHPAGKPILPEEWTIELLHKERDRLGKRDYSHFYLNVAMLPEEQLFGSQWLREYRFREADPRFSKDDLRNALMVEHKVYEGTALKDFMAATLEITIIVDPNHARKNKREKHVIWSIGFDPESSRIYLLSLWQKDSTYSVLVEEMYSQYANWTMRNGLKQFKTPTVYMGKTARELLAFYLSERDKRERIPLQIEEFEDDDSLAAMKNRIESLEPTFKAAQIWCNPEQGQQKEFVEDYENYPAGKLDALDVLGHYPRVVEIGDSKNARKFLQDQMAEFQGRQSGIAGY